MAKTERIGKEIYFSRDVFSWMQEYARKWEMTVQDVVRIALIRMRDENTSAEDVQLADAERLARRFGYLSVPLFQRNLKVSYKDGTRIVEKLRERGCDLPQFES